MKRKDVRLPAPAQLCSSLLGQRVVFHRPSLRQAQEELNATTDVTSSLKVQAAVYSAQNSLDTALADAVRNRCIPQTIARLLAQGACINTLCDGLSPLSIAIINKDLDTALFLLMQGANPSLPGELGNTPLHLAALCLSPKTLKIAEILITAGADINAQNTLGQTPLHLHGKAGAHFMAFAKLLIKQSARLDLVDIKGQEPLARLTEKKREELLRYALFAFFNR